ncbi:sigma-70 family RNA polymerase sigma factor [Segatella copri]|uniref:sigma-70 family RNA polymerase sigma factor n=1 Tax=Segatella copri TaxID=165179 RepID=UPI001C46BF61|nr:sigma-70 family RNA polymerase sigma factor [Segatella copri]MBW0049025.1 sigma-70 family RNA polymerase sigma factor [Segatella copri]
MKIEKLIERVKAGDTDALKTVYEAYSQRMRNACIRITQEDEDTVDDLVQESFIRAYYSLEKLKDASKFGEWVVAITKNVSLRYLERKRKIQVLPFSEIGDGFDVESSYTSDSKLEEKELFELIDKLPSGYRNVFRMAVIDGFSHKEIAEKLGIEPHSSSSQLTRAKVLLRNMINRRMLAVISILLVSIPIYKYLFWKRSTEKEQHPVANINDAAKGKRSVDRETEQPTTQSPVVDKNILATASPGKMNLQEYAVADSVGSLTDYAKNDYETDSAKNDSTINVVIAIEKDTISLDTMKQVVPKLEEFIAKEVVPSYKSKWQLLAMGSLGSALAQTAYKMLVGNKGEDITDGPQPSGPQMFSTWEQYSQYLQQNAHGNMSEAEKALMEIAINNTNNINNIKNGGKIVEHEYHDKPITFGLSMTKTINRNWNMETGLQYSLLKSEFILGEDDYYIQKRQKVQYLGIPLRLSYKWFGANRWTAYTSAGIILNIPLSGKTDERYVTGTVVPYSDNWHFTPPFQWTVGTGVGLQYNFANNWGVYLEPTFSWHIPNGSTTRTIWTEHPFTITVPFGIRFTW